ncbi:ATP-binding cassette domain-containing protein [Aliarcobacter butzleri]|uniref:ATP-binding cassette domain-containing protein n=1 Tax=Aliarcobacter butzleri TaxID=28197 RepID=UPI002B24DC79|nr:ATP-binding cassette domain-containing protein [Aliarcobacter butzleri]
MELVYLWVEKYKNIEKQGFNFSPRFRCEFKDEYEKYIDTDGKEKEKLKDNCELIIEKNEYKNIFPDNINITAIVGENGSGKSSLLNLFELKLRKTNHFIFYKKEAQYYCEFNHVQPKIVFSKKIKYIDRNSHSEDNYFYPKMIRIAHNEKIGKNELSHFYFGLYSGIYGGWDIDRHNNYNMLEARFFVPRYINIVTQHAELFNKLSEMYKFDTLRLLLKDNSTSHVRKWIDKQINTFVYRTNLGSKKVCVYEKNEQIMNHLQKELSYPIEDIEIHLYNRNREKIVSILENIETMHRQQTSTDQIKNYNKFQEFDLALLIAFT